MKEKLEIILKAIGEKKGEDILVFAFSSLNPAVDEVVIASASNQRQVFALADNVKEGALASIPMKKFGSVQDVANVVRFLCSEESSYITGQVIAVDGGMVM